MEQKKLKKINSWKFPKSDKNYNPKGPSSSRIPSRINTKKVKEHYAQIAENQIAQREKSLKRHFYRGTKNQHRCLVINNAKGTPKHYDKKGMPRTQGEVREGLVGDEVD